MSALLLLYYVLCVCAGYSSLDIVTTVFKVVKSFQDAALTDELRLDMLTVVSGTHMRVADGVGTQLQMDAMVAKLAALGLASKPTTGRR